MIKTGAKTEELRGRRQRLFWPDGTQGPDLAALQPGDLLMFHEVERVRGGAGRTRRLLLRVGGAHTPYPSRGAAVAALKQRVVPQSLADGHVSKLHQYTQAWGEEFYSAKFGTATGGAVLATPIVYMAEQPSAPVAQRLREASAPPKRARWAWTSSDTPPCS